MAIVNLNDSPQRAGQVKVSDSSLPDGLSAFGIRRDSPILVARSDGNLDDIIGEAPPVVSTAKSVSANTLRVVVPPAPQEPLHEVEEPMRPRNRKKRQPTPEAVYTPPPAPIQHPVASPNELIVEKTPVVFSSTLFGRMKCSADVVTVSERLVVIGIIRSDFELELPAATLENPITISVGEDAYTCVSGQWTADIPLRGSPLHLLLFVRVSL